MFPVAVDLDFYNARRQPPWANKLRIPDGPSIDSVINAHAGIRVTDTQSSNLCVFIRGWQRRGEPVIERLLETAAASSGTNPRKRSALARKWAQRLHGSRQDQRGTNAK